MSFLTRAAGAIKLAAKAHAPTIMVVAGVTAMGGSAVMVGRRTLKLEETLEPHADTLEHQRLHSGGKLSDVQKTELAKAAGLDVIKLYAAPAALFAGGAALVFGGHRVMLKRNATLAIAFTAVSEALEKYRARVREEFGSEADQAMLNGYNINEVIDPKTGKVATVNQRDWDAQESDPYNRIFSRETSPTRWIDDLGVNQLFVSNQQRMANIQLGLKGYLYLNDVYESLGIEKTDIGQVVGWKVKKLPDGSRDIPFVDFGIDKPHPDDWKYNSNNEIYLDFNCSGLIVGGRVQKALEQA